MEVVVQNGANHCLSRSEVESMTPLFPAAWSTNVKKILLARGNTNPSTSYYPKAKELCISCSSIEGGANKAQAVSSLLIALAAVATRGDLPQPLSASLHRHLEQETADILASCIGRLR